MLKPNQFVATINDQKYYFKVTISNGDKNTQPLELTYYMVEELQIEETLFNWNVTASLVIKNDYEFIERGYVAGNKANKSPYIFRHDGRNKVNVRIFPVLTEGADLTSTRPELNEINYDFVVYDVIDMPANDQSKKRKKMLLWDERYQHFLERNIQWSTYYVVAEKANTTDKLSNISCKVGLAIKHLIQTACGESKVHTVEKSEPLKVGWNVESENPEGESAYFILDGINKPSRKVATFGTWDEGSEENKISYTSPASSNVIEDLEYLLKYYVSSIDLEHKTGLGMPGFLRLDRYHKKWELVGLDQFYAKCTDGNKAGEDTIERVEVQLQDEVSSFGAIKTPVFNGSSNNFTSKILSYRFVNLKNSDDLALCNRPAIRYDNDKCLWDIYFENNTPDAVVDSLKKNFIPKTFNDKKSPGVLINLNKDKLNGFSTFPEHVVVQGPTASVLPRNDMISSSIFLNQALEFNSLGGTTRTPGKFINVERSPHNHADNDFENKFIGQWLLIRVVHTFFGDKYLNNTTGVKFNSFMEIPIFNPKNDLFTE